MLELSDRIYVMKDGAVVAELEAAEADVTRLHQLMVGRSLQAEYYREPLQKPFRERGRGRGRGALRSASAYRDVSFKLHAGEILGIAGVIGSGPRGADPHAGRLRPARQRHARRSAGARCASTTPAEAVDLGIGYVPRERRVEGLVLFLPVAANITLADLGEPHRVTA